MSARLSHASRPAPLESRPWWPSHASRAARLRHRRGEPPRGAAGSACGRARRCSHPIRRRACSTRWQGTTIGTGFDPERIAGGSIRVRRPRLGGHLPVAGRRRRTGSAPSRAGRRRRSRARGASRGARQARGGHPAKYSSSSRRTDRSRSGASRMRGEIRSASSSSSAEIGSPGIREAHQAASGDHDGQRAQRRVVDAVGDVEDPLVRRRDERARRAGARGRASAPRDAASVNRRSRSSVIGGTSRRSRRRPALTLCRAASSLVPIRAPISPYARSSTKRCTSASRCLVGRLRTMPQMPSSDRLRLWWCDRIDAVELAGRPARHATNGIGRLAAGDRVQPGAQVVAMSKPGICAKART